MSDPNKQPPEDVADAALDEVVGGVLSPRDPASGQATGYIGETEKNRIGRPSGFIGGSDDGSSI